MVDARSDSNADQAGAAMDQDASDRDQAASDQDEADAASDQRAAEIDHASSDDRTPDFGEAGPAHDALRLALEETTASRRSTHVVRARTTRLRAETANLRDASASERDETAQRRDLLEEATERSSGAAEDPLAQKLGQVRARATAARARAAAGRDRAAQDQTGAAREFARLEAELQSAHLDDLTGAFRRDMGRLTLNQEIDRARRTDGRFVLAYVDVDGMKLVNDRDGHAAGDHVLQVLVLTLRSNLRSFDPIVRYGGDEFVCGLGGVDRDVAVRRFEFIDRSVRSDVGVGISVGLAGLEPDDTLELLTARADASLLSAKKRRLHAFR